MNIKAIFISAILFLFSPLAFDGSSRSEFPIVPSGAAGGWLGVHCATRFSPFSLTEE